MNGYELCRQIKANSSTENIPVILLTSLSDSMDVLEGLACGADNFITKPYNENYLLPSIEQILVNRKLIKGERVRVGAEIQFDGKRRFITADQHQILTLLLSTYETAVNRNSELVQTQNELKLLNESLEDRIGERTAALSAEIAERKRAEETLRERERMLSIVTDNFPGSLSRVDLNLRYLFANPKYEEWHGRSPESILGLTIPEVIGDEAFKHAEPYIRRALAGERVASFRRCGCP